MTTSMLAIASPLKPGSSTAKSKGCRCSHVGNFFGRGHGGEGSARIYEVAHDCPLHAKHPVPGPVRCDECGSDMIARGGSLGCPKGCFGHVPKREPLRPQTVQSITGTKRQCTRCGRLRPLRPGRPPKEFVCTPCRGDK